MPLSAPPRRCRHCAGFPLEGRTTYSSVLVTGSNAMRTMVESLEERIIPCVTAVCPDCDRVSLISDGSTESMLCSIYMWQRLREWIDTRYEVGAVGGSSSSSVAMAARVVAADGRAGCSSMIKDEEREAEDGYACDSEKKPLVAVAAGGRP
jgi:hypothetical protein